ncbi:radical SAM protein [Candidatus Auribacterota bacterium]
MNILIKKYIPDRFLKRNLDVIGFFQGKKAFSAPTLLQIDLINACNLKCIACWCHSSDVAELGLSPLEKKELLSLEKIQQLIETLAPLGLREVQISGGGEPFLHPHILEILKIIKQNGIRVNIITNFTLMTEAIVKRLVELKVDYITASIWAGTKETYAKLHPDTDPNIFFHIKEMLKLFNHLKQEGNLPQIKIYNVISHLNCHELESMLDLALEGMVDFLEFTVVDIVEGKTDYLKLTSQDKDILAQEIKKLKKRINYPDVPGTWQLENLKEPKHKEEFMEFGRFMKDTVLPGFTLDLEKKVVICPKGIKNSAVFCDEFLECAFFFSFPRKKCDQCSDKRTCPVGNGQQIKAGFLSIVGFGSFTRRIFLGKQEGNKGQENSIIDSMPCYAGWIYAKISANGDVLSCCKAHKVPVGNINEQDFLSIWNSKKQQRFRYKGKHAKKNDPFFMPINCYKACDNLGMNLSMHEKIKSLKPSRKLALYLARIFYS